MMMQVRLNKTRSLSIVVIRCPQFIRWPGCYPRQCKNIDEMILLPDDVISWGSFTWNTMSCRHNKIRWNNTTSTSAFSIKKNKDLPRPWTWDSILAWNYSAFLNYWFPTFSCKQKDIAGRNRKIVSSSVLDLSTMFTFYFEILMNNVIKCSDTL